MKNKYNYEVSGDMPIERGSGCPCVGGTCDGPTSRFFNN